MNKLHSLSEIKGFDLVENENRFMSQRCSCCGWVQRSSRKGKTFKCANIGCNFVTDSDLNAASNHSIGLRHLTDDEWQQRTNSTGFHCLENEVVDDDFIVYHT